MDIASRIKEVRSVQGGKYSVTITQRSRQGSASAALTASLFSH